GSRSRHLLESYDSHHAHHSFPTRRSSDLIGLFGGFHLFRYPDDPLTQIDPHGLDFKTVDFSGSRHLYPVEPGQLNIVKIVMQGRSEEHTSELQSRENLVCRPLLENKNKMS